MESIQAVTAAVNSRSAGITSNAKSIIRSSENGRNTLTFASQNRIIHDSEPPRKREVPLAKKRSSKLDHPRFTLDYWKDGRWYVGRLREVPSVISQGRTLRELKANIADAYKLITKEQRPSVGVGEYQSTMVGIPL